MSDRSSGKSHIVAWVFAMLAVPALYLLSVPPVWRISLQHRGLVSEEVVSAYEKPYYWLVLHTSLGKPLGRYSEWCLPGSVGKAFIDTMRGNPEEGHLY
jgi:hypothetical protein